MVDSLTDINTTCCREMTVLRDISDMIIANHSRVEQLLPHVVDRLAELFSADQGFTVAITYQGKRFLSRQAINKPPTHTYPICYQGKTIGAVEIICTGNLCTAQQLQTVDIIAGQLSLWLYHHQASAVTMATNDFLKNLMESVSDAIFVIDQQDQIMLVNQAACDMTGYDEAELVNHFFAVFFKADLFDRIRQKLIKVRVFKQRVSNYEIELTTAHQRQRTLLMNFAPLYKDEQADNVVITAVDITEEKAMHQQLAQANKLESLGQLAAGIAHEINTPAQYISDNMHFLQDGFNDLEHLLALYDDAGLDPQNAEKIALAKDEIHLDYLLDEIPQAVQQSLQGVKHINEIVTAMQELAGSGTSEKRHLDINNCLQNVITVSRNEWKYVANINTELADDLPLAHASAAEINQALLNIVINAAQAVKRKYPDASQKGTITIQTARNGDKLEIRITDDGIGIPSDVLPRVFDPFFTTQDVGQGAGQGLAIAYAIIREKHQGSIEISSKPDVGTAVIITLPLEKYVV